MSKFIFLIQTLLLITFAFTFTNCVNYSSDEDELQIQFSNFIQKYGKVYKSQKEKEYRFNIYKNNYQSIALHNSQLHSTYKKAMNKFGDLTSKEFEKLYKPNKMFLNNSLIIGLIITQLIIKRIIVEIIHFRIHLFQIYLIGEILKVLFLRLKINNNVEVVGRFQQLKLLNHLLQLIQTHL